jgi:microcystin-dependent protein
VVDQYLGEIKLVGFNFAPVQWAQCAGQIIPLSQNTALFSLFGTMYGGNGTSNFGLPDLRGRAAGHVGPNLYTNQGLMTGTESVNINMTEYPAHSHPFNVNGTAGTTTTPSATEYLATISLPGSPPPPGPSLYVAAQGAALQPLYNGQPVSGSTYPPVIGAAAGGSQPHENRQPYLAMTYCVALQGIYPARG